MKQRISRISLTVYAVLFALSGFLLSAAGGRVEWLCIMGVFAIPSIFLGPRRYRVLGAVALLAAIMLATIDFRAGQKFRAKRARLIENAEEGRQATGEQLGGQISSEGAPGAPPNESSP